MTLAYFLCTQYYFAELWKTLRDVALEVLALFSVGDLESMAMTAVTDEAATVRPGRWHQLGGTQRPGGARSIATPANQTAAIAAVTVASTADTPVPAAQGISAKRFADADAGQKGQYIVDYERARIYWTEVGHPDHEDKAGIVAGTGVQIDYTPVDPARSQVRAASKVQRGSFRYIEDAAAGTGRIFYAPSCTLSPGGDMALLDGRSSEQQVSLTAAVTEPASGAALYIDGQAA